MVFFFLFRACGEGLWPTREERDATQSPPHARFVSECKQWNLEHVVLDLFSHITLGNIRRSLSAHVRVFVDSNDFLYGCFGVFFGWVTVCCAMVQHLIVSLFLNSLTMAQRGAQPRIRCRTCVILEQRIGRHSQRRHEVA